MRTTGRKCPSTWTMRVWANRLGPRCSIKGRKRAVKLGGFTALTLATEGGIFPSKGSRNDRAFGAARPSDRSLLNALIRGLADHMRHERTAEPHH
jgi:hypothetical protein